MNWFDVLPAHIATSQIAWERRRASRSMRDLGFTYAQIGQRLGVSPVRAQQLGAYRRHRPDREGSPAAAWMNAGFEFKPPLVGGGTAAAEWLASALDGFVAPRRLKRPIERGTSAMSQTAKLCREHAGECREMARHFRDPIQRRALEDVAQAWDTLAVAKARQEAAAEKSSDEGTAA